MLDEMTPEQFLEWRAYSILEPFEDVRTSYYLASIVKALWDINRDTKKHPQPLELEKFLIQFGTNFAPLIVAPDGSAPRGPLGPAPTKLQSPEEKSRNLKIWAMAMAGGSGGAKKKK
jgi:hypothetical protein